MTLDFEPLALEWKGAAGGRVAYAGPIRASTEWSRRLGKFRGSIDIWVDSERVALVFAQGDTAEGLETELERLAGLFVAALGLEKNLQ